jgi:1,4-dihydroxy-2-naphthoyl-CoA hydrolase
MTAEPFTHRFEVALHDIDAAGVMFFGHLFRHAHDAYEAYMARIGFPLDAIVRERRWLLPLVHAEADYLSAIRHGERIRVMVSIAEVSRSSFTVAYRFLDTAQQLRASARTVHVQLAQDGSGSLPLSEPLRAALVAGSP